ncbi:recombinase family protein [Mycolicibacterium sp. Dal123E01]|uniref:recombinase family protein n=1 Tax=Mycolicibacterium sp. Dal123E01 TaxID=3457578 RepID=UPI00403E5154
MHGHHRISEGIHRRSETWHCNLTPCGKRVSIVSSRPGSVGSTSARPGLDKYLDHLREGDVLNGLEARRLGRNAQHVLAVVENLASRRIDFRSLTEGLHTDGPMGKAMLTIMAGQRSYLDGN